MQVLIVADDLTGALDSAVTLAMVGLRVPRSPAARPTSPPPKRRAPTCWRSAPPPAKAERTRRGRRWARVLDARGATARDRLQEDRFAAEGPHRGGARRPRRTPGNCARPGRAGDPAARPDHRRGSPDRHRRGRADRCRGGAGGQRPGPRRPGRTQRRGSRRGARGGARRTADAPRRGGGTGRGAGAAPRSGRCAPTPATTSRPPWCWRSGRAIRSPSPRSTRSGRRGSSTTWPRRAGTLARPAAPGHRALLVRLAPGGADIDPRAAGARFARWSPASSPRAAPGRSSACGGETTDAILGELGVGVLAVEGEVLPGVPVSRMVVNGRTMRLVTKSGGFGAPGALISVVDGVGPGE